MGSDRKWWWEVNEEHEREAVEKRQKMDICNKKQMTQVKYLHCINIQVDHEVVSRMTSDKLKNQLDALYLIDENVLDIPRNCSIKNKSE